MIHRQARAVHVAGIGTATALVCGVIAGTVPANAATNTPSDVVAGPRAHTTLPVMVVTPTRDERPVEHTPYYTDVLRERLLRTEQAARSVPEALKYQTGTMVQKTAHGQGSPYIRGFTGFRNLFLIDGIRLNNSVFRDGPNQYWNTVDALGLDRIEFVKGPSSVLYGSDAVGGTLNVFTRGVSGIRPDSQWDRCLYYRYSTAERSHVARVESIALLTDDLGLTVGYSRKDFGDVQGDRDVGLQEKTGYDEQDWDAKLEYTLTDGASLVLAHQGVDIDDAWRTHKTIYGIDWEGLSVGDEYRRVLDQDRQLTYLQYHHRKLDGFCSELHAGLSHQVQEEERERLRSRGRRDVQGFDVNTLGAFVQLTSPTRVGQFIYGAEYYHDDVESFNKTYNRDGSLKSSAIQGPVADDATYDLFGLYVQDNVGLTDRLSAILGCRYEYAAAAADSVEDPDTGERINLSDHWDAVAGSGRLLCHLDQKRAWNLFAGVSQGFRAPNLSDLTRLDSARTDEIETPAPDLEPEEFVCYEIGLKANTPRVTGQLAYFYTDIEDMIVRTPTGRMIDGEYEITKQNVGDGYLQGIEAELRCLMPGNLTAFGSFTWIDGEVETYPTSDPVIVTEPIDRLMPPTGRLGLRWDAVDGIWVEAVCTMAAEADKLSTRDESDTSRIPPGGTPGYTVCDVRAGWQATDDLTVSVAVENVTDEDYRIHGSGVNEPGRNLVLAGDWTF